MTTVNSWTILGRPWDPVIQKIVTYQWCQSTIPFNHFTLWAWSSRHWRYKAKLKFSSHPHNQPCNSLLQCHRQNPFSIHACEGAERGWRFGGEWRNRWAVEEIHEFGECRDKGDEEKSKSATTNISHIYGEWWFFLCKYWCFYINKKQQNLKRWKLVVVADWVSPCIYSYKEREREGPTQFSPLISQIN